MWGLLFTLFLSFLCGGRSVGALLLLSQLDLGWTWSELVSPESLKRTSLSFLSTTTLKKLVVVFSVPCTVIVAFSPVRRTRPAMILSITASNKARSINLHQLDEDYSGANRTNFVELDELEEERRWRKFFLCGACTDLLFWTNENWRTSASSFLVVDE